MSEPASGLALGDCRGDPNRDHHHCQRNASQPAMPLDFVHAHQSRLNSEGQPCGKRCVMNQRISGLEASGLKTLSFFDVVGSVPRVWRTLKLLIATQRSAMEKEKYLSRKPLNEVVAPFHFLGLSLAHFAHRLG